MKYDHSGPETSVDSSLNSVLPLTVLLGPGTKNDLAQSELSELSTLSGRAHGFGTGIPIISVDVDFYPYPEVPFASRGRASRLFGKVR